MIRLFSLRDFTGRELHLLFLLIEYLKLVLRGGHEGNRKNCLGPHLYIYQESCPYLIDMIIWYDNNYVGHDGIKLLLNTDYI